MEKVLLRIEPAVDLMLLADIGEVFANRIAPNIKWRGKYDGSIEIYHDVPDSEPEPF